MTQQKIATIFGATGFIGRYVVQEFAQRGYTIRAASRTPNKAFFLKPCGNVGQVVPFPCDGSKKDIEAAVKNADVVVNCVGILFEKKKRPIHQNSCQLGRTNCQSSKQARRRPPYSHFCIILRQSQIKIREKQTCGRKESAKGFP